jgi:hypothetical protein
MMPASPTKWPSLSLAKWERQHRYLVHEWIAALLIRWDWQPGPIQAINAD